MFSVGNDRSMVMNHLCNFYPELMLIINVYCLCLPSCRVAGSESHHNSGAITHSIVIMMLVWINTTNPPSTHTGKVFSLGARVAVSVDLISAVAVRKNCHLLASLDDLMLWRQPELSEGENGGKKCH